MKQLSPSQIPRHLREIVSQAAAEAAKFAWSGPDGVFISLLSISEYIYPLDDKGPEDLVPYGKAYFYRDHGRIFIDRIEVPEQWLTNPLSESQPS